ncbi:MAG: GntR family transcriptional regulator [bacterium]|nr:GntR family transcriptional regulator [bacterium]
MASNHLWQDIFNTLLVEIGEKNLRPGDRFQSLEEVCNRFGVSVITARRAFDELEQQGWIKRFKYRGAFIAKTNSPFSVKLVLNCPWDEVGLPMQGSPFVQLKLVDEMRKAATRMGIDLQLFTPALISSDMTGANIVVLQGSTLSAELIQGICKNNNAVFAHVPMPIDGVVTVRHDLRKSVDLPVRHLLDMGHRRIGLVLTRIANDWMSPRFQAYEAGLRRHKLAMDWRMVAECISTDKSAVFSAMERLMNNPCPPTAVIASNDEIALAVMDYCRLHGLVVPRDLSLVGCDNTPDGEEARPGLTSVETHFDRMAEESLRLLLASDASNNTGSSDTVVAPELIVRGSTAPPQHVSLR